MKLIFSELALQDLASIKEHTRQNWGDQQAEIYIALLEQSFLNIQENPEVGAERPEVIENCRYLPEQSHLIFYRIEDDTAVILGIPHSSMDIERYLERDEKKKDPVSRDFDRGR